MDIIELKAELTEMLEDTLYDFKTEMINKRILEESTSTTTKHNVLKLYNILNDILNDYHPIHKKIVDFIMQKDCDGKYVIQTQVIIDTIRYIFNYDWDCFEINPLFKALEEVVKIDPRRFTVWSIDGFCTAMARGFWAIGKNEETTIGEFCNWLGHEFHDLYVNENTGCLQGIDLWELITLLQKIEERVISFNDDLPTIIERAL